MNHDKHERIVVRGMRDHEELVWLLCLDCTEILRRAAMCGRPTKRGRACRSVVLDEAMTTCRVHVETQARGE